MATLEDIKEISSTSAANYSTVILEFEDDVNMDSITVDILQKISMIEGGWDEMVGTPTILKINPNMLPVMVSAVGMEGMDTAQLSEFTEKTLLPALEGTAGVADISVSGLLNETVQVTLSEEKLAALNETVREQIDKELDKALSEIDDAKAEIESGKQEIESGKQELENGKQELNDQTAAAEGELTEQQAAIQTARVELTAQLKELRDQLATLEETETMLATLQSTLKQLEDSKTSMETELTVLRELQTTLTDLRTQQAAFAAQILQIETDPNLTDEQKQAAVEELKKRGITVITHVILGLPGESREQMLETVRYVGTRTDGIKLQLLHVLKGTDLAKDYEQGTFQTLELEEYCHLIADCLRLLPKDVVIHRLTGDGAKKDLIAPLWSGDKKRVLNTLHRILSEKQVFQGELTNPQKTGILLGN